MDEQMSLVTLVCDADWATPRALWTSPTAPVHYPAPYHLRKRVMVQVGTDGVPEVIAA